MKTLPQPTVVTAAFTQHSHAHKTSGEDAPSLPKSSFTREDTGCTRWLINRRQFGPKAKEEVRIIEHQTQTLWLMPHLATVLALTFTSRYAGALLDEDIFQGKELVSSRALQALMAGLKAYSTWENVGCLQDCRESTGRHGERVRSRGPRSARAQGSPGLGRVGSEPPGILTLGTYLRVFPSCDAARTDANPSAKCLARMPGP
ncbi:acyl-coenzyme A oxidase-like protein [Ictidomys tridecemlineatus]